MHLNTCMTCCIKPQVIGLDSDPSQQSISWSEDLSFVVEVVDILVMYHHAFGISYQLTCEIVNQHRFSRKSWKHCSSGNISKLRNHNKENTHLEIQAALNLRIDTQLCCCCILSHCATAILFLLRLAMLFIAALLRFCFLLRYCDILIHVLLR